MGKQILTFAKLRASEIEAKSLEICPFKSLKVRSVDQRPNSAESGRGIKALKGLKLPEFWPSKFVQSISQKEVKRRRAIWSQALGQAVADAARWSSAPWDTMPAWGSACTGMIHWIRLFTLASGMSCIKCEMQSHCFDLLSYGAFFFFLANCALASGVVLMCYMVPWGGTLGCSGCPSASGSSEFVAESTVNSWRRPGIKPVHSLDSSPSHTVMHPKRL